MENRNEKTSGRKRNIILRLGVTEAEKDLIYEKMEQYSTNNFGAYARKMLIDGYVINVDTTDIKAVCAEMQKIGVNINQIARRVNATSRIYEQDFTEIQGKVDEIWRLLRLSLLKAR
ncbi:MAG: MobC family plasmid mobilization relaxosome protein [Oscillospiraceae bacterium]|nr:MobC family plasmid mobilization relaxosome protein [Oscillospiraceae bacterium]